MVKMPRKAHGCKAHECAGFFAKAAQAWRFYLRFMLRVNILCLL
jgi:hypothetical protein